MEKEECVYCKEYMRNSTNQDENGYFIHKKCIDMLNYIAEKAEEDLAKIDETINGLK